MRPEFTHQLSVPSNSEMDTHTVFCHFQDSCLQCLNALAVIAFSPIAAQPNFWQIAIPIQDSLANSSKPVIKPFLMYEVWTDYGRTLMWFFCFFSVFSITQKWWTWWREISGANHWQVRTPEATMGERDATGRSAEAVSWHF